MAVLWEVPIELLRRFFSVLLAACAHMPAHASGMALVTCVLLENQILLNWGMAVRGGTRAGWTVSQNRQQPPGQSAVHT